MNGGIENETEKGMEEQEIEKKNRKEEKELENETQKGGTSEET